MNQLSAEFFINNRARLRQVFTGTAPIVISGNYLLQQSADQTYPFVQDSNFWYVSGLDEPGLTLVIDGDKEYIIAPEISKSREIFDGGMNYDHLRKISGIETVLSYEEGWKTLGKKLAKVKHVATISPASSYIKSMLMYTSPAKASLLEQIKEQNNDLEFIDLRKFFTALRSIKTLEEIEQIIQATNATAKLYKVIQKAFLKANNEADIMAEASKFAIKTGSRFAYTPIVAGGKNAVTLHYNHNNFNLDDKDFLLVDAGLTSSRYCADITRTVVKNPTKRQKAVYDAVISVQDYAVSLLRPGIILKDYEQKVHDFMGEKLRELGLIKTISPETVGEFYPHSTSHFLGIDTHDEGDYELPLEPGMVLTVEPGIYIKQENIGIRIEDDVLITKNGCKVLSKQIKKDITKFA